jgi:hypothetical protein
MDRTASRSRAPGSASYLLSSTGKILSSQLPGSDFGLPVLNNYLYYFTQVVTYHQTVPPVHYPPMTINSYIARSNLDGSNQTIVADITGFTQVVSEILPVPNNTFYFIKNIGKLLNLIQVSNVTATP